ncbi:hypothetical protein B0H16DRAFT_1455799 [Mycena metata]|uniref:Uncharacterized protein n=1 Tax=Mycena metata TaxID=1033252 RepID=A0AAD7JFB3_9AGAR|nr:hypothetical protein B0H16DRAFT_1455799 [Mycena metata]
MTGKHQQQADDSECFCRRSLNHYTKRPEKKKKKKKVRQPRATSQLVWDLMGGMSETRPSVMLSSKISDPPPTATVPFGTTRRLLNYSRVARVAGMSFDPDPSDPTPGDHDTNSGPPIPLPSTPTPMHPSNLYYPQLQQQSWSYGPPAPFALVPHPYYPSPFPYTPITPIPAPPLLSAAFSPDTESDKWAIAFAGEFFNGIVPGTASGPQRRAFKWPIDVVTPEDRLLVVIRAIRKAGFPTIGSFLAALFERKYNKHSSVYNSVASFLRGAEDNTAHHPVTIVDLISALDRPHCRGALILTPSLCPTTFTPS